MVCQRARALSFCLTDLFFKSYATSAHVHKGSLNGHLWKQLEQNFHMLDVLPSESKEALLSTSLKTSYQQATQLQCISYNTPCQSSSVPPQLSQVDDKLFTVDACIGFSIFHCIGAQLHTNHSSDFLQIANRQSETNTQKNKHCQLFTATNKMAEITINVYHENTMTI